MVSRFLRSLKDAEGEKFRWAASMRRWSVWKREVWLHPALAIHSERGGRAKRYFRLTKEGIGEVRETRQVLTGLWRRLPDLEGDRI